MEWLLRATGQELADAQETICDLHYYGQSILKDYPESFMWVMRAAIQGFSPGECYLYYMGYDIPKDYTKAAEWFLKAGTSGRCISAVLAR